MAIRESEEIIKIESKKRGEIEVVKTYIDVLSEQLETKGQTLSRTLVKVTISGSLTEEEKEKLAVWFFSPTGETPKII